MGKYDTSDVKSVQKFLANQKDVFDKINSLLPEDAEVKLDYDAFVDGFFKANEGILKNRDALKQEKLELSKNFEEHKAEIDKKWGSIDENIQELYNEVVKERDALKAVIKDGKVDIDDINKRHASEMQVLENTLREEFKATTNELVATKETLATEVDKFKGKYFDILRTNTLTNELDRIKVNPEDRQLIMQANIGRAEIVENDKGDFEVVFVNGDERVPSSKFWDTWAADSHNQRYILAEDNSGGGASGATNTQPTSVKAKWQKILDDPTTPPHQKIVAMENLKKLD